jgi:FAD:protein FMN transferase
MRTAPFRCALLRAFVLLALVHGVSGCTVQAPIQSLAGESMGTTWSAQVVAPAARVPELRLAIERELDAVVAQMSTWESGSVLSRYNRAAPGTWHPLPPELFDVFAHSLALARDTGGAYDPTVGPLVDLWGFGSAGARDAPPSPHDIDAALARVGWNRIELDAVSHRALQPGNIRMDVSSLGPGHAIDRIGARLRDLGVTIFLVELGGEMLAAGRKPDGSAWRVAVEPANLDPDGNAHYDTVIALEDAAAGSSGDYRAGFEHAGRRYSHTLDPRTGAPVTHDLAGVTAIASTAMQADALAAALMVLGPDDGLRYAREHGIAAVFSRRTTRGYVRVATDAFERHRGE